MGLRIVEDPEEMCKLLRSDAIPSQVYRAHGRKTRASIDEVSEPGRLASEEIAVHFKQCLFNLSEDKISNMSLSPIPSECGSSLTRKTTSPLSI